MKDRIKLAEAMGWVVCRDGKGYHPNDAGKNIRLQIPDPFTDANDDYAVLEWMRDSSRDDYTDTQWGAFLRVMADWVWQPNSAPFSDQWWTYKIGDYARAALKVIE